MDNLIDTNCGSHNTRCVKSFVRGFRFGITAARSSCPMLRMLSATMNRLPASKWDKRHGFRQVDEAVANLDDHEPYPTFDI